MKRLRNVLRRGAKLPGVPQARYVAERAVAPYLRAEVASVAERLGAVETHMPVVLNAIASTNGTARILRRELGEFRQDMVQHIDMIGWLLQRVETVRAEVMMEMRYGQESASTVQSRIVNEAALSPDGRAVRLNLGAGHLPLDGYVNIDMRELPGIDVIAALDDLPFGPGTVAEIHSAHVLEHFPLERLRRTLMPYWVGLLAPGGTFRAVVPDLEATAAAFAAGTVPFEVVRSVTYGGQEYEGDCHFTGFTPASLAELLTEAGLRDATIVAAARPNGDCLECEVTAVRQDA